MPIGSFADSGTIENETIVLSRALLEIKEITLNYGDDPEDPSPYQVKNKNDEVAFISDPNINVRIKIVDDYTDGDYDDKEFYDKFYLKLPKELKVDKENTKAYLASRGWKVGGNSKLGMLLKAHPNYGPKHFENPKPFDEKDLEGFQFEAATEQREDRSGKKLDGTRINWESIGVIPNRDKKNKKADKPSSSATQDLSPEDEALMNEEVFDKVAEA